MKTNWKLLVSILVPLVILLIPVESFGIVGLDIIQQRVIALFFLAALLWILEPIPIYATSLLIIVLELITISTSGLEPLVADAGTATFGELIPYQEIMATFASPIIMLFLGGFFLAMAATKYRLDQNLARVLLKPFGTNPKYLMLGIMAITATFSMFMSNTATTAMMLSLLVPVLAAFDQGDAGKIGLALSIPFAANIGGIATPIGTPPNAIALKYLTGTDTITFGSWMVFGLPYVLVMLFVVWVLLIWFYPSTTAAVKLNIKGKFLKSSKAYIVYVTFGLTILLWLFDFLHGMNAYVVGLIPVGVFLATNIITKEDLKKLSWDVLWLVSGGIALGLALDKTGLAANLINNIAFDELSPYVIVLAATVLATLMANFMSNTATANLLLPIIAVLGTALPALEGLGGSKMLILSVAMAASLGMALPISTPPNALAHATGLIKTQDMTKVGVVIGLVGLIGIYLLMFVLKITNFF
ncbi:MAG: SLC13 family permease [Cyclobacteriaceae bacterium]